MPHKTWTSARLKLCLSWLFFIMTSRIILSCKKIAVTSNQFAFYCCRKQVLCFRGTYRCTSHVLFYYKKKSPNIFFWHNLLSGERLAKLRAGGSRQPDSNVPVLVSTYGRYHVLFFDNFSELRFMPRWYLLFFIVLLYKTNHNRWTTWRLVEFCTPDWRYLTTDLESGIVNSSNG